MGQCMDTEGLNIVLSTRLLRPWKLGMLHKLKERGPVRKISEGVNESGIDYRDAAPIP